MRFDQKSPARIFEAGLKQKRRIKDCGNIHLEADEQVTFITERSSEYDVVRKEWGFYATPSTNSRLISFGIRACIVRNLDDKLFILLVEKGKENLFYEYIREEEAEILFWLDTSNSVSSLKEWINNASR